MSIIISVYGIQDSNLHYGYILVHILFCFQYKGCVVVPICIPQSLHESVIWLLYAPLGAITHSKDDPKDEYGMISKEALVNKSHFISQHH